MGKCPISTYGVQFGQMCKRVTHGKKKGGLNVANLVETAKSGDKYETLLSLRDILAKTIQECDSGRDMASNTKRLMEVMNEIETIEKEREEERIRREAETKLQLSKHDRLKKKREAR